MSQAALRLVEGSSMDKSKALDAALSQIERSFGKGSIMRLGKSDRSMDIETISSGSLGLDIALGVGGLPRGRVVEIFGPESSGKTTLALHTVAEAQKGAMFSMFEHMDAYHPGEPHWHLPLIGVDPARQGRGIGSALQRHVLEQCDRQQVLAYLEATSPRNVSLYERHGFEALGNIQVADAPPIVPMVRKPR